MPPTRVVVTVILMGGVLWAFLACVAAINCGRPYSPEPDFYDSPWLKPPDRRCTESCSEQAQCDKCLSECTENAAELFFLGVAAIVGGGLSYALPLYL